MKVQCDHANQIELCKNCHHAREHALEMIPFQTGLAWCDVPSECHHLQKVVKCEQINYQYLTASAPNAEKS